jgi:hypothetical protein
MLYARTLTRGIRRFAPDLLTGNAAYTAEEVGEDTREAILPSTISRQATTSTAIATEANGKPKRGTVTDRQLHDLKCCREMLEITLDAWRNQILTKRGVASATELSTEAAAALISSLKTRMDIKAMEEGLAQQNGDLTVSVPPLKQVPREEEVAGAAGSDSKSG